MLLRPELEHLLRCEGNPIHVPAALIFPASKYISVGNDCGAPIAVVQPELRDFVGDHTTETEVPSVDLMCTTMRKSLESAVLQSHEGMHLKDVWHMLVRQRDGDKDGAIMTHNNWATNFPIQREGMIVGFVCARWHDPKRHGQLTAPTEGWVLGFKAEKPKLRLLQGERLVLRIA
jgi:hypothetical protein